MGLLYRGTTSQQVIALVAYIPVSKPLAKAFTHTKRYVFFFAAARPCDSFLQESVKQNAIDHRARWQADREHADRVRRREREEDAKVRAETKKIDHDAFIARQAVVRLREKEQREQDRLDRKMEYEETWRLEESRRAHELKVLAAQIELARCRSK